MFSPMFMLLELFPIVGQINIIYLAFDTMTYCGCLFVCWQTPVLKWNDHTICATELSPTGHCQKCHVGMMWKRETTSDTYCWFLHLVHQHSSLGQQSTIESSLKLKTTNEDYTEKKKSTTYIGGQHLFKIEFI